MRDQHASPLEMETETHPRLRLHGLPVPALQKPFMQATFNCISVHIEIAVVELVEASVHA